MAEIMAHVELGDVTDGACQLHPGRSSANDDEIQFGMGTGFYHLPLRQLKRQQHPATNLGSIFDGLQPRRPLRPFIFTEVRMGRARAQDQVVIVDLRSGTQQHAVMVGLEVHYFIHQYFDIPVF